MSAADEIPSRLAVAQAELHERSEGRLALIRAFAAAAVLALCALLGYGAGLADWRAITPFVGLYFSVALVLVLLKPRGLGGRFAAAAGPTIDVLVVFGLQAMSLPISPHPDGVAGWSLGPFVFLVLLASLTLRGGMIVWTALLAFACEAALQRMAGVGYGAVFASGIILAAAAAITIFAAHRVEELVERVVAEEVSARLESRRSEELLHAREELRRANEELEEKHQSLMTAQRAAETLTNVLVHDMKSPLSAMLAYLDLVEDEVRAGTAGPQTLVDLAEVRRSSRRVLGMVSDLLGLARLESEKTRAHPVVASVHSLLSEVVEAHRPQATQKKIALTFDARLELAARLDVDLTRRLLENLVENALRFVPAGGRIELCAGREGSTVVLRVRNDGPPIPREKAARLFEKFAPSEGGKANVGLGLYFCKLAAEMQGGRIGVEWTPEWPVTFAVTLPGGA